MGLTVKDLDALYASGPDPAPSSSPMTVESADALYGGSPAEKPSVRPVVRVGQEAVRLIQGTGYAYEALPPRQRQVFIQHAISTTGLEDVDPAEVDALIMQARTKPAPSLVERALGAAHAILPVPGAPVLPAATAPPPVIRPPSGPAVAPGASAVSPVTLTPPTAAEVTRSPVAPGVAPTGTRIGEVTGAPLEGRLTNIQPVMPPAEMAERLQPRTPEEVMARAVPPPPPLSPAAAAMERPEVPQGTLRGQSVTVPPRTPLETVTQSSPVTAATVGLKQSISGLLGTALAGGGGGPTAAEQRYDPTLLDTAVQGAFSLAADPLTAATFLIGSVPGAVAGRQLALVLARKFGGAEALALVTKAAEMVGRGASSFAGYDALTGVLRDIVATERGQPTGRDEHGQPAYGLQLLATATQAARGAVTGAALGAAGIGGPIVMRLAAETGILATAPPLLEGRAPSVDDWINAGILIGTLNIAGAVTGLARQAIEKPRAARTPAEAQAVEAIPQDVKRQIVDDASQALQRRVSSVGANLDDAEARLTSMEPQARETILDLARQLAAARGEAPATEERLAELRRPALRADVLRAREAGPSPTPEPPSEPEPFRVQDRRTEGARGALETPPVGPEERRAADEAAKFPTVPGRLITTQDIDALYETPPREPLVQGEWPPEPAAPETAARRPAPVTWVGWQESPGGPPIELWNLSEAVGDRPSGDTVSRQTLEAMGLDAPAPPEPQPAPRPRPSAAAAAPEPAGTPPPEPASAPPLARAPRGEPAPPFEGADLMADPAGLERFIRSNGGLAPSPTGDLIGEYRILPFHLKNRRGLSPDLMAQAVSEAVGYPVSDAELLDALAHRGRRRDAITERDRIESQGEAPRTLEERAQDLASLRALPAEDKVKQIVAMTGLGEDEARRLVQGPDFVPGESQQLGDLRQALRDFFSVFPDEPARHEGFDLVPVLRDRFGDASAVARDLFGGDVMALDREMTDAKRDATTVSEARRRRVSEADKLRQYDAERSLTPERKDIGAGLTETIRDIRRRIEVWREQRTKALERIVSPDNPDPAAARATLAKIDAEITDLLRQERDGQRILETQHRLDIVSTHALMPTSPTTSVAGPVRSGMLARDPAARLSRVWGQEEPLLSTDAALYPPGTRVFARTPAGDVVWTRTDRMDRATGYPLWRGTISGRARTVPGSDAWNLSSAEFNRFPVEQRADAFLTYQLPGDPPELRRSTEARQPSGPVIDVGPTRPALPGETPRYERTALGDQAMIPGTEARAIPDTKTTAETPQRPVHDLPLFADRERTDQPPLPGVSRAARPSSVPVSQNPKFRRWFGESRVVDEQGRPKVVYRGDYRADLVGAKPDLRKTTSGRFYFTDDPAIASSYAANKEDVHAREAMSRFEDQYTFPSRYGRRRVNLTQLWHELSRDEQDRVREVFLRTGTHDDRTFDFSGEHPILDQEGWKHYVREARGNWLKAGKEVWLSSGALFDTEDRARFLDILREAGVRNGSFDSPEQSASAVTPVYLRITHPLDTRSIPEAVVDRLRAVARADRTRARQGGAFDQWDKKQNARVFMERLEDDLKNGTTYAWTSVPETITRELQRLGYDGIQDVGGKSHPTQHAVWIAFEPWQIKSALGNRGAFDIGSSDISRASRVEPAPVFFSQARAVIDQKMANAAPASMVTNLLRNAGVKPDEMKWTGLDDYLRERGNRLVSKQEVQDFLQQHEVRVTEVLKGGALSTAQAMQEIRANRNVYFRDYLGHEYGPLDEATAETYSASADQGNGHFVAGGGGTGFDQYVLPGGQPGTYRELLLTLPGQPPPTSNIGIERRRVVFERYLPELQALTDRINKYQDRPAVDIARDIGSGDTRQSLLERRASIEKKMEAEADAQYRLPDEPTPYRSPHWDTPNVLAHVRFNDRVDAEGKRVLFLEEIQSDWGQSIRRHEKEKSQGLVPTETPPMPFAKTWHELALRRMLRYAAEHGYDRIAWAPGSVQAERYDLSKHVDYVMAKKNADGTYLLGARLKDQQQLHTFGDAVPEANLDQYIGKDLAQKIIDRHLEPGGVGDSWSGGDLKVGGEGMKGFYDKILPDFLNKYGKKWGARVGETTLVVPELRIKRAEGALTWFVETPDGLRTPFTDEQSALAFADHNDGTVAQPVGLGGTRDRVTTEHLAVGVPSLDITPAMAKSVLEEGQPSFMARRRGETTQDYLGRWRTALRDATPIEGTRYRLADPTGAHADRLPDLARASYARPLAEQLADGFAQIQHRLGVFDAQYRRAAFVGFSTDMDDLGVTVHPEQQAVLLNPWSIAADQRARVASGEMRPEDLPDAVGHQLAQIVLHELTHQRVPSHADEARFHQTMEVNYARAESQLTALHRGLADALGRADWTARFFSDADALDAAAAQPRGDLPAESSLGRPEPGPAEGGGARLPAGAAAGAGRGEGLRLADRTPDSGVSRAAAAPGGPPDAGAPRTDDEFRRAGYAIVRAHGAGLMPAEEAQALAARLTAEGHDARIEDVSPQTKAVWVKDVAAKPAAAGGAAPPPEPPLGAPPTPELPEGPGPDPAQSGSPEPMPDRETPIRRAWRLRQGSSGERAMLTADAEREAERARSEGAEAQVRPAPGQPGRSLVMTRAAETVDALKKIFAPASRGEAAQKMAGLMREKLAVLARKKAIAEHALKQAATDLDTMPAEAKYDLIDRIEGGDLSSLPGDQRAIAQQLRDALDSRRGDLERLDLVRSFIDNYFPHVWKDPEQARDAFAQVYGRRPLAGPESFRKQRKIPTVKEGRALGLELVSDNPVTLTLLKLHEMDRSIMGHEILEDAKQMGLAKFFRFGQPATRDWARVNDKIGRVFGDPNIPIAEAFDERLMKGLGEFAASLGIDVQRAVRIGGRRWGYTSPGGPVVTKFAGPETVLTHEIGHQLDFKYGLAQQLTRRGVTAKELRALADLRYEGKETTPAFKTYVREGSEKIANLVHAYVHAPERAREVAPKSLAALEAMIADHPELAGLRRLKPSLVLGTGHATVRAPGAVILGEYWMPEPAARLLNNYLTPGLWGNPLYDGFRGLGNMLNQMQLGFSAFHAGFVTMDAQVGALSLGMQKLVRGDAAGAAKDIGRALVPGLPAWRYVTEGNRMLREYFSPGSQGEEVGAMVEALEKAGGRARQDVFYKGTAADDFWTSWRKGEGVRAAAKAFPALMEYISRPIMEHLVPRMKLGAFADLARFELARLPEGASDEEARAVLARAWDSVDNRLGQVVYDDLFWRRTGKDLAMITVRSVGWNMGTIRELGGGLGVDLPKQAARAARGQGFELTPRMAYAIALPMITALYGALYQYAATGQGPTEVRDYFFPKTGERRRDGSDDRVSLPGYMKDVYAYGRAPFVTMTHKLHPEIEQIAEMLRNEDFYGAMIRNPDDPVVRQVYDLVKHQLGGFESFSLRNFEQQLESGRGVAGAAQSFVGITPAPATVTRDADIQRALERRRERPALRKKLKGEARPGLVERLFGGRGPETSMTELTAPETPTPDDLEALRGQ